MVVGRVFAAVPMPAEARLAVAVALEGLEIPGRLSPPENWHLTLRFLGSVDEVAYERFLHGLAPVAEQARFPIALGAIGAFPNARRATVVWAGVEVGMGHLASLAAVAEAAAVGAGLDAEERPFRAHFTLSRVRPPADVGGIVGRPVPAKWRCDRVVVYRSVTGRGSARYEPLETLALLE